MTDRDEPDRPDEPERDDAEQQPEGRRGQIRFQDPETTKPRAPTLGEQRARKRAVEQERERELAEREEAERKSRLRRRILIGSGVTVGVVAVIAVWYAAATPDEVTARCVTSDSALSPDENYCDENYVTSHGGYHSGGFFFIPIPGGGYNQYRYNYGGTVGPGNRVTGGSTVAPSGRTTVKTASGKTVQRGGFGISSGGKSGGS
ncbi:MAG TPA: hypothetical protein VGX25_20805 [Actinophytocola sp.]|uniref:hypothetical protein n=1 Tax=Actinophytocola sp. TaxID=1872138 RepID=UPI002DDD1422|nr:hypothetical protein [Actinophytocola sp.]HEV2781834.1 hypothetical protein [Actinophytocola sp.]